MHVEAVCWDWNGTLLDDADICRKTMNQVLREHELDEIVDLPTYRSLFTFPIPLFYRSVGIDESHFVPAARRYLELLETAIGAASLHQDALETLHRIQARGIRQVLASATRADPLRQQMAPHRVHDSFDEILSIDDAMSPSKRDVIADWLRRSAYMPSAVVMVGDTNHDQEIADELGTRFVHYSGGHQNVVSPSEQIARLTDVIALVA